MQEKQMQMLPRRRGGRTKLVQESLVSQTQTTDRGSTSTRGSRRSVMDTYKDLMGVKTQKGAKKKFEWKTYKRLLKYMGREWKLFFISIVCIIITSFLSSMLPLMVGLLLDEISKAASTQEDDSFDRFLETNHLELLLIIIAIAVITFVRAYTNDTLAERISIALRKDVFDCFINNDIHFFEKYKSGELNSRLVNDINQAKSAASNNISFLCRNLFTITGNICILMFMSWRLSLMVLIIVPLYGASTMYHNRRSKMYVRQYQDVVSEASNHINQVFTGVQVVKAFSGESKQSAKYMEICKKGYDIMLKKSLVGGFYHAVSSFLPNLGILMVLWYGGNLVRNGNCDLTAGELTSFIMYCTSLSGNASAISNSYSNIINGTAAVQKVFEMMEYVPQINEKESNQKYPDKNIEGEVTFVDVGFRYPKGEVQVMKNLCLHIKKGEYVAFVGQSGSGKSTIVKLIERFYDPQFGQIYFDDTNAKTMSIKNLRDQIGFVSQEAILFSGTIEENVTYGVKDYSYQDMIEVCEKSGCMEFIGNPRLFPEGFKTVVGQKGNTLSGGQRQRISIARALMRKPKILIFDEATSALDSNSEYIVQQSIQKLVSDTSKRMTIIIIAHRLSTIMNAQRIFVMKQGEVIEEGTHETLLMKEDGYYGELVAKQLQNKLVSPTKANKGSRPSSEAEIPEPPSQKEAESTPNNKTNK